jgi:hypothetical protein
MDDDMFPIWDSVHPSAMNQKIELNINKTLLTIFLSFIALDHNQSSLLPIFQPSCKSCQQTIETE